jgi:hypothetical protein
MAHLTKRVYSDLPTPNQGKLFILNQVLMLNFSYTGNCSYTAGNLRDLSII